MKDEKGAKGGNMEWGRTRMCAVEGVVKREKKKRGFKELDWVCVCYLLMNPTFLEKNSLKKNISFSVEFSFWPFLR